MKMFAYKLIRVLSIGIVSTNCVKGKETESQRNMALRALLINLIMYHFVVRPDLLYEDSVFKTFDLKNW